MRVCWNLFSCLCDFRLSHLVLSCCSNIPVPNFFQFDWDISSVRIPGSSYLLFWEEKGPLYKGWCKAAGPTEYLSHKVQRWSEEWSSDLTPWREVVSLTHTRMDTTKDGRNVEILSWANAVHPYKMRLVFLPRRYRMPCYRQLVYWQSLMGSSP